MLYDADPRPAFRRTPHGRAMDLEGTQLSHYRLAARLGEGGMGVVYRAHDERLRRDVALKLLPASVLEDAQAHARLLREARMASALNHPNVCTIHEAGEASGQTFVAMELVEGRPLGELVPPEGLAPQTVCRYGMQIADALDHAHQRGVVHRDLKLSNLMATPEGRIKVLDFGLSRRGEGFKPTPGMTTASLTPADALVGTPLYLAPEVWRGEKADERSDLWALGVVLYQMACGSPPFSGVNEYSLSAAILNQAPASLPVRVPAALSGLILRCLEKDPRHRFRSAGEVRAALETLAPDPARSLPARRPRSGRLIAVAAVVAIATASALYLRDTGRGPARTGATRQLQLTSNSPEDPVLAAVISPDGRYVAFAARGGLFLKLIATGETRTLPVPEGWNVELPIFPPDLAWFPDGTRLLLDSWIVSVQGGAPGRIADRLSGGAVSPDGSRIAFVADSGRAICAAAVEGEGADTLARFPGRGRIDAATWSPDGRWLAFMRSDSADWRIERIECFDTRTRRTVLPFADSLISLNSMGGNRRLCWLPDGRLVFSRGERTSIDIETNLWFVRLDPRTGKARTPPERLTAHGGEYVGYLSRSADGGRLGFLARRGQGDVYVADFEGPARRLGTPRRFTLNDRNDALASWTPDSRSILFTSERNGTYDLFRQALDAEQPEVVAAGPDAEALEWIAPDRAIVFTRSPYRGGVPDRDRRRFYTVPIGGGTAGEIARLPIHAQVQCDVRGRSVLSEEQGSRLVFFACSPGGERGRELARVDSVTHPYYGWALSPDGTRVLLMRWYEGRMRRITLVNLETAGLRNVSLGGGLDYEFVNWASDGKGLIGTANTGAGEVIFRSALGGRPEILFRCPDLIFNARESPDGRHLAFARATHASNAWLIEGF